VFQLGLTRHVARDCQNQGNGQGGPQIPISGGTPEAGECSHNYAHTAHKHTCTPLPCPYNYTLAGKHTHMVHLGVTQQLYC